MGMHSHSWQIILVGSLSKCIWGRKLWCSSKVEKSLITEALYILSYYEQLWKHVFILTICLKICNLNEKSQGVPFLFPFFLRICEQSFSTPVDSRAISNAIKAWSKFHWNQQVAFYWLYRAFWWAFSSFGSNKMHYCFYICVKKMPILKVLLRFWGKKLGYAWVQAAHCGVSTLSTGV